MTTAKKKTPTYETFDSAPDTLIYQGAHVRWFTDKSRTKVSGPSGEVLYFVNPTIKGKKVWRALVAWRPEGGEHTDQFVDVDRLRLENTPPPEPRGTFGTELKHGSEPPDADLDGLFTKACADCGGELKFDPDLVGDTVGGLTLRGWMVCQKCGKGWLAPKGMATVYDGGWKLAKGGRSVETGNGRIRVDGGTDVEALMARIVKLPDLEVEVAKLRKYVKESQDTGDAFRALQHRVHAALESMMPISEDDIPKVNALLEEKGFARSWELACAVRYAINYGKMP